MSEPQDRNLRDGFSIPSSDRYFNSLIGIIPHFIFVINPETLCIRFASRRQPGLEVEGVIGKNIFDFVLPEFMNEFREKITELKETNANTVIDLGVFSKSKSDGKAWYRIYMSVVKGPENQIENLLFLAEDITERKLNEVENINKGEKIKAIINNTSDIICSIDRDYNLTEFNSVFSDMIKYSLGVKVQMGMPMFRFVEESKHGHLSSIYEEVLTGKTSTDIQIFGGPGGLGGTVYFETNYHPINNIDRQVIGISIFSKDITERVKSEHKIQNALKEKEVLLEEIHHRIKNNLAMVSSLLELQEMNIQSPEAKEALEQSRKRIKSTALIHELLYRSESFQYVRLKDYLTELFSLLNMNDQVKFAYSGDEITLDLSRAFPLGLMLNELLMNSFKHSYSDSSKGSILFRSTVESDSVTIDYCDFEGSFPDTIVFENSNTTGLMLMHTFAKQLEGSIDLVRLAPPAYKIQFPLYEPS